MSDSDSCTATLLTVCCNVLAGICLDFISIRSLARMRGARRVTDKPFIEHPCIQRSLCYCCTPCEDSEATDDEGDFPDNSRGEREPLISKRRPEHGSAALHKQPTAHRVMNISSEGTRTDESVK